jgi:hypothetical protein
MRVGWFGISDLMDGKEQEKERRKEKIPTKTFY